MEEMEEHEDPDGRKTYVLPSRTDWEEVGAVLSRLHHELGMASTPDAVQVIATDREIRFVMTRPPRRYPDEPAGLG